MFQVNFQITVEDKKVALQLQQMICNYIAQSAQPTLAYELVEHATSSVVEVIRELKKV